MDNTTINKNITFDDPQLEADSEADFDSEAYINSLITFYGEGVLLTVVSSFGLVGNVMSIIVLTRSMNSRSGGNSAGPSSAAGSQSFSNLLRGLATFDALFLLVAIMSFGLPKMSTFYVKHIFRHIMIFVYGFLHTFRVGSVYVTLAVTFERFHAIICPLRHFRRKKYMLPFCISFAILYNIPKYFELQIETTDGSSRVTSTTMRENKIYVSLYLFWSKFIFIEFIPYTTILIMNIFIIIKITKSARFRKKFQTRQEENESENHQLDIIEEEDADAEVNENPEDIEVVASTSAQNSEASLATKRNSEASLATKRSPNRATVRGRQLIKNLVRQRPRRTFTKKQMEEHNLGIILIAMSSLFIFCQSFKIIPDMYELILCNRLGHLGADCKMKGPVINAILRLSHLLVCVNSSANFLIYYARGERFRRAWIETFGECWCRCCKKPSNTTTVGAAALTTQDGHGHLRMNPLNGNSINGHTNHTMLEAQETRVTFV